MLCCTADMSDDALIRRANLRALGKTASERANDLGNNYSYWAGMLTENSKKSFGDLVPSLTFPPGSTGLFCAWAGH